MNSIKEQAQKINAMLHQLDIVKDLQVYEIAIDESDLLKQEQELFLMQQSLVHHFDDDDFNEKRNHYLESRDLLENNPLFVNYRYCVNEVNDLIYQIKNMIEKNLS